MLEMAENVAPKSKNMEEESSEGKEADITSYFNNAPPTIFDEIAAPKKLDFYTLQSGPSNRLPEYDNMSICAPSDFFTTDTLLEADRSVDHTVISDMHRDAWIPSERTRKILRSIATSTGGSNTVDKENLTMPGLVVQGDIPDLIKTTAIRFLGEDENIHRNVLTASDVTQDERGLRNLIQNGCYRAAVNLSGRLLGIYGQGYGKINQPSKHTPHSLQLWYTRLSLLTKLKQMETVESEAKPFGNLDKPDMYFIFYPELYGTRPGSMVPFAFRLLLAEVPAYCGKVKESLDRMFSVLATVNRILANLKAGLGGEGNRVKMSTAEQEDAVRLWTGRKSRVLISIINCAVNSKNYVLGIELLENLSASHTWTEEQLQILKSATGRSYLFLGDISAAEKLLIKKEKQENPTVRELIDRGLMAVAQNAFQEAFKCFQTASAIDPSNILLINNMAVCLLYNGQLKSAVQLYESMVTRNPVKSLQEGILLNMCTSYELHTTHSKQTKLHLLRQLNRYKGDAIDIQCLKLSM